MVMDTPPELQKTPEMNELETDKIFLKIWAHNFEKQKSYRSLKSRVFFCKKKNVSGGGNDSDL